MVKGRGRKRKVDEMSDMREVDRHTANLNQMGIGKHQEWILRDQTILDRLDREDEKKRRRKEKEVEER